MKTFDIILNTIVILGWLFLMFQCVPTLISSPSDASVDLGIALLVGLVAIAITTINNFITAYKKEEDK
jgi:hypothetical protein